jgi:RNA polymerase sigma factor (sigma-70 family)
MMHMGGTSEVSRLVRESAEGNERAWDELVRRYAPLVMAVIRSYRLSDADAQDVSQTVWLRLVEHVSDLREPDALPGWLSVTTQRECGRHVQQGRRTVPVDPHAEAATQRATDDDLDAGILRAELRQALRDGLAELPLRGQVLLSMRAADPPKSYREISQQLGMPQGSISPTIQRYLDKLRETSAVRAYLGAAAAARMRKGGGSRELAPVD